MNDLGTPSHQFTNLYTLIVCLSEELLSEATISLLGADVTISLEPLGVLGRQMTLKRSAIAKAAYKARIAANDSGVSTGLVFASGVFVGGVVVACAGMLRK